MTKKTIVNGDTQTQSVAVSTARPAGDQPPTAVAPAPPVGWKKTKGARSKEGLRPQKAQLDNAVAAASELTGSETYAEDFLGQGPDAETLATNLTTASKWRDAWTAAKQWLAYCAEQRGIWDEAAYGGINTLKPVYDFVTSRNAGVAKKYTALGQVVNAKSAIAQSAAVRKKTATKKAAKAASVAPSTPVVTASKSLN
jgi:hypothetical protein